MSDLTIPHFLPARPAAGRLDTGHLVASLHLALRTWLTRQALLHLPARELADLGLSPTMAIAEAARLPWDVAPASRRTTTGVVQRMLEQYRMRHLTVRRSAGNPG